MLAWQASSAILIVLVGILFAIVIDAAGRCLEGLIEARKMRLLVVMAFAALLAGAAIWWGGTTIVEQAGQFVASTRGLLQRFNQFLSQGGLALFAGGAVDLTNLLPSGGALFGGATQALTTTFGVLATAIAIFFLGAFLAWEPDAYKSAILSLLPKNARTRVNEVQ